ncbi:uncharacterized protein LOC110390868 isoform X1 [Numida meleagris]|uniref:uncharacterized protein LOC110390868 isoform X1 n=1 Tax=Numida meleagris TaxID=8996 RepID=UPI000B3D9764|nr:uncharacterized protein LOC110390868 isoform X1 [Numida meleagris]
MESSSEQSKNRDGVSCSEDKCETLLGQLLGHLTLCRAEVDQEIRHGSEEALRAIHSVFVARESYSVARAGQSLYAEGEWRPCFRPYYLFEEKMALGRLLLPMERGNLVLTVLEGMVQPRVSDTGVVATMLDEVLRDGASKLSNVPEILRSIYEHLMLLSKESLRDIVIRTLFQITPLDPQCVVRAMLRDIPWCDRLSTTMWQTMVSEPSLAKQVVYNLLMQRPQTKHDGFGPGRNCVHHLHVGFWMTPCSLPARLRSPPLPSAAPRPLFPCPRSPSSQPAGSGSIAGAAVQ